MFQRMAAYGGDAENLLVQRFKDLGKSVCSAPGDHPAGMCVARGEKKHQQEDGSDSIELHNAIGTQIAGAHHLAEMPIEDAGDAECQQRRQANPADPGANPISQSACKNTHETDSHRQTVPDQRLIGWRPVIIDGSETSQRYAQEKDNIRPPLIRFLKRRQPTFGNSEHQTPNAGNKKRQIGNYIEEIGNSQHRAAVGKPVIGGILRNTGKKQYARQNHNRKTEEYKLAPMEPHGFFLALLHHPENLFVKLRIDCFFGKRKVH
jgi:hypothetical protein